MLKPLALAANVLMAQLGMKPSEAIKRVLEDERREKSTKKILAEAAKASEILKKVSEDEWTDSVRKSRDER